MKRLLINIVVFVLLLPIYILILLLYICNLLSLFLINFVGKTKQKPYKWFNTLDIQMYKLYKNVWK